MEISVIENGTIQLKKVFLPIALKTEAGEEMIIAMRDSGFEIRYQGIWYEAKVGKLEVMIVPTPETNKQNETTATESTVSPG